MLNGMLRNTLLIAKREYVERIRSRVFRITTLLVPIGMGGLAVLGSLSGKKMEGVQNMAIVSSNPELAEEVKAALLDGELPPKTVDIYAPATDEDLAKAEQRGFRAPDRGISEAGSGGRRGAAGGDVDFGELDQLCQQSADGCGGELGADSRATAAARRAGSPGGRADEGPEAEHDAGEERHRWWRRIRSGVFWALTF